MPPRRPTSSQNSKANNDVPHPLEGLPPMNVERLYRYLENLAGLVKRQARAIETQALDNPHLLRDCPKNKKFIIGKLKEENKEDKHKPRIQGRMFSITHQDAQATSDVATA
ncbi:hypothetical protein CK203_079448 [Vitis vinifera]|uniref:Uncharacterized protein n=1 Tax=Vitis vinifera TaxID=29760 RepID=A0A438CNT6_VITVI|nr:hypothetical protein CK203_079448 [Vitis vinifera]